MKQFHFTLEAVLRLRSEQLEKARHSHAECTQWRARAAASVAAARLEIDSCHAALASRREHRSTRSDQLLFLNALQYQQSLLNGLNAELARVERELETRRLALLAAQRKVDALERLRERKERAHAAAGQRRDEAMIDDLISARYTIGMPEVPA